MSSDIDQIKDRIDIVSLVSEYIDLKKAGINHQARCPFHNEKTPSFYVSSERGTYKCFGCGEGGDIFTFTEKMEGIGFRDALTRLAAKAGVELKNNVSQRKDSGKKDIYLKIMQDAVLYWQRELGSTEKVKTYLKNRGFTKEIVQKYRVGFAPEGWENTKTYLLSKGYTEKDIESVGAIKTGDRGKTYDRFRSRVMFPLFDITGRPIAVSGRYFGDDDGAAKYINSPETPLFNKSKVLYGMDTAKQEIRKYNFAVIVEGQVDLIMSQQVFPNTVASSGTSLTKQHLELIRRFGDRVVLVYDGDAAGLESAYRGALLALETDFEVRVAVLPDGKDPADVILDNVEDYKEVVSNAKDVFEFYLEHISNTKQGREVNMAIEEKIFPLLYSVENPLEQDRYVRAVAQKLSIAYEALKTRLEEKKPKQKITSTHDLPEAETISVERTNPSIERLIEILLWQKSLSDSTQLISESQITAGLPEPVIKYINLRINKGEYDENEIAFRLENLYKTSIILENDIKELQKRIEKAFSKKKLDNLKQQLQIAEQKGLQDDKERIKKEIANLLNIRHAS